MALAPGVFMTTMPLRVAASVSTLSTPTPARPITRSFWAASISFAFTSVAERTTSASASRTAVITSPICSLVTISKSGSSRKTLSAAGETFSAMRIFMSSCMKMNGSKPGSGRPRPGFPYQLNSVSPVILSLSFAKDLPECVELICCIAALRPRIPGVRAGNSK